MKVLGMESIVNTLSKKAKAILPHTPTIKQTAIMRNLKQRINTTNSKRRLKKYL
jgi:hypothetical protein